MGPVRRGIAIVLGVFALVTPLSACVPAVRAGSLEPTLEMDDVDGGSVAFQNGIPVPTFEFQARLRIDLDGTWRVERRPIDDELSMAARDESLDAIVEQAAGRERPGFDDGGWEQIEVPGTLNPPPDTRQLGGWYRRTFDVPASWTGASTTLKFGAVNYIADVWLNGVHLGYHEGGYTPFAFDVAHSLLPGQPNLLVVRVDNPPWGTRNDIVPWGLTDWWNYGGITRSVWLEATPPIHAVRADVVPHLDGADVSVVLRNGALTGPQPSASPTASPLPSPTPSPTPTATVNPVPASGSAAIETPPPTPEPAPTTTSVHVEVLPARVTPDNVADPDVRRLVPGISPPLAEADVDAGDLEPDDTKVVEASFRFGGADRWSPAFPALYVLHVRVTSPDGRIDDLWSSFGLRRISVDPDAPRLLLNGEAAMFHGVGLHDEVLTPADREADVTGQRVHSASTLLEQLDHARAVGADLIRTAHTPANPLLLMLADRLGFAVWEEIPLYHFTPLTFGITMGRGIPQQMLREMALRDMNHPAVLFHGLANESTGQAERNDALRTLHDIDRKIDGTRLTGQAAYGSEPADPTQAPLDVAGYTFYYGVFYGASAAAGTEQALQIARRTNPGKPILALEFGRWSDGRNGPLLQQAIFTETYPAFERHADVRDGGFVGLATWWTLEDYLTMRPGILVEHFGLYDATGAGRPAADSATRAFAATAGKGAQLGIESSVRAARVDVSSGADWTLFIQLGYALLVAFGLLAVVLGALLAGGGRAIGRRSG